MFRDETDDPIPQKPATLEAQVSTLWDAVFNGIRVSVKRLAKRQDEMSISQKAIQKKQAQQDFKMNYIVVITSLILALMAVLVGCVAAGLFG